MNENKYDAQHACNYDELLKENDRLKELLNEFSNALEYAVKQEPRLIYFEQIQSCIKKISRVVQGE